MILKCHFLYYKGKKSFWTSTKPDKIRKSLSEDLFLTQLKIHCFDST